MRSVLFIAYHFPPMGGGGVQRTMKFVRHLPAFGYRPVVVTGPREKSGRWAPSDETLADETGKEPEVHRVEGPEPPLSAGWRGRRERWLGLRSPYARWWLNGALATGAVVGRDADVVFATMPPYPSGEAAMWLARDLQKPLVVDLRDPWALDEMTVYPTALHRRTDLARMRRALDAADVVIMNTPEARERVLAHFPELPDTSVVTITNGFDAADFERPPPRRENGAFRIVHTGYLHTELGRRHRRTAWARRLLGGRVPGIDILPRSHVFLLEAVDRLLAQRPELAGSIEVHLAGVTSSGDERIARAEYVRTRGYLSHAESVDLIRSADLLFLPMHDVPEGTRATVVPGKTYEYLASGRPILAAVPEGDARDLLLAAGTAHVCRPTDGAGIMDAIAAEIERARAGRRPPVPPPALLARYERRGLTKELAAVFDSVLAQDHLLGAATLQSAAHARS